MDINLEEYQKVWEPEGNNKMVPLLFPKDKPVFRPFTTTPPPSDEDVVITGFNWNANQWEYVLAVSPQKYEELKQGMFEIADVLSELMGGESNG